MDAIETRFNFSIDRLPKHPISKHRDYQKNHENVFGSVSREDLIGDIPPVDPVIVTDSLFTVADAMTNETILQKTFSYEMVESLFKFLEDAVIKTEKNKCIADLTVPISARNATIDNRNFGYA